MIVVVVSPNVEVGLVCSQRESRSNATPPATREMLDTARLGLGMPTKTHISSHTYIRKPSRRAVASHISAGGGFPV